MIVSWGCLLVFLCGFGGFLLLAKMFQEDSARLPSDLERARKLGLPLSVAELQNRIERVPDSENAAFFYRKVISQFRKLPFSLLNDLNDYRWVQVKRRSERKSAAEAQRERNKAVKEFDPVKKLLRQATCLPKCDFQTNWNRPEVPDFSMYQVSSTDGAFLEMTSVLSTEARYEAERGDIKSALEDLNMIVHMARHASPYGSPLRQNGVTVSQIEALFVLWQIIAQDWNDGELLDKAESLIKLTRISSIAHLYEGGFVEGRAAIGRIRSLKDIGVYPPEPINQIGNAFIESQKMKEAFDARFVRFTVNLLESMPQNPEDWVGIQTAIAKAGNDLESDRGLDSYVTKLLNRSYSSWTPINCGKLQTLQRMLLTSIDILRRRNASGVLPNELVDSGLPNQDPFTHKPFHYRRIADGFTISGMPWSVEPNLPGGKKWRLNDGDQIVLRFPAFKHRSAN